MWLPINDILKDSGDEPKMDISVFKDYEVSWLMDLVDVKIYELKKNKEKNYSVIKQYETIKSKLREVKKQAV